MIGSVLPNNIKSETAAAALRYLIIRIKSVLQQADVAQLVEQLIRNQQVVSSTLTVGSIESIIYRTQNAL